MAFNHLLRFDSMTNQTEPVSQKTILIVDDQKETIRMVATQLMAKNSNLKVINAINGEIAYSIAEEEIPDIILMDWDMPVMNGIEATRMLKKNEVTHQIPVIMATGRMTSSEDLQMALEAGAVDYVRKPIDIVELSARINTALRISDQSQAIQELLKGEIELKNRKLTTASMLIVEKNGLLQQFHHDLEKLEELTDEENKVHKPLKSLKKRVMHHIDIDQSWETFKLHFDEVHPHFFSTITQKAKDLSHKDLKLCAYLKLGMENKQIAQLLNITSASTRTSLSRLKRRLGIPEELDLRTEILKLN